ncbi:MAG: YiiX/YebB-like N1pC/P60 family cysteine hydrolase [Paraclostridium sp.]
MKLKLKEGTLLFGNGKGITASIVKFFTISEFSHVGILTYVNGEPMVIEANSKDGVCETHFSEWLTRYEKGLSYKEPKINYKHSLFYETSKKYIGRDYERNIMEFILSVTPMKGSNNVNSMFCSEFVYTILHDLGRVPEDVAHNFTPKDLIDSDVINKVYNRLESYF